MDFAPSPTSARLARIEQLTGLGIGSDAEDELTAHLALLILRMQRLAKGRRGHIRVAPGE